MFGFVVLFCVVWGDLMGGFIIVAVRVGFGLFLFLMFLGCRRIGTEG